MASGRALSILQHSQITLQASARTLLGSVADHNYKSIGWFYTHFDNVRSVYSTCGIGFSCWGVSLAISSGASGGVTYSYNGSDVHGSILAGETLTFDRLKATSVSVKCASTANPAIRIWAWG
jgi:hypothetical protein